MTNNTQLPVEVQERIKADSIKSYPIQVKFSDQVACMERREGYIAGATAYATKLHEANENRHEAWKLLEEVIKYDETFGATPTSTIQKIKRFLYGE